MYFQRKADYEIFGEHIEKNVLSIKGVDKNLSIIIIM